MSRAARFVASLGSSYVLLVINIFYTAVSIPLALKFLPREQYGVWVLVLQISGYLMLLDVGVGQSVSRVLIDHKDEKEKGDYGAFLKAAWVVFGIQAAIVLGIGVLLGPFFAEAFKVPPSLKDIFAAILALECLAAAIVLAVQPLYLPLWGHQRSDVVNWYSTGQLLLTLLVLWLALKSGLGLWALVIAALSGSALFIAGTTTSSVRLGFLPKKDHWGQLRRRHFGEIFGFSREIFILIAANQVLSASQVMLATRVINLDAAAAWAICSKTFILGQQVVWRISDFSGPGLSEMVVRGEKDRFQKRVGELAAITFVVSGFIGVLGAFYSRQLISFWTHGAYSWPLANDVVFASYLLLNSVFRAIGSVSIVTKRVERMKYVVIAESILFVLLSLLTMPRLGLLGIIVSSVVADTLCLGSYSFFVISRQLGQRPGPYLLKNLGRPAVVVAIFAAIAAVLFLLLHGLGDQKRFFVGVPITGLAGVLLMARFGIPSSVEAEVRARLLPLIARFRKPKSVNFPTV